MPTKPTRGFSSSIRDRRWPHAAILQYRPVNTDVLPAFVLLHLLFAPLLWLLLRMRNVALGASILLYGLVQIYGWNLPQWPSNEWYFNPFAWQILVVLGARWELCDGITRRSWLMSRAVVSLVALYLLFPGSCISLRLQSLSRGSSRATGKGWRRQFYAVPFAAAKTRWKINCAGVLLALAGHILLVRTTSSLAVQIAVSAGGVATLIAIATVLTRIKIESRSQPRPF